jgi:imidazoleglycerol-phosphate dehydratase
MNPSIDRTANIKRNTKETDINLSLNLDGKGTAELDTGIPFLDHMVEQIARHGLIDLSIDAKGDLEIDAHHTVEDIGICFGEALRDALGDKAGILRYGHAYVPLDEALSRVVLDLSGRPGLEYHINFPKGTVGGFDIELFKEFFQAVSNHGRITLHIDAIRGDNNHHIIETVFKAFGRALRMAVESDPRQSGIPSTKGAL